MDNPLSSMDWNAYTQRLFQIESGGNPNAVTGSNRGLGQFSPDLEAKYGITDANRTDPAVQAQAVQRLAQDNAAAFQKSLGRAPSPAEMYLMHQQGVVGGPALLKADAGSPAWQAIRPYYNSDAIAQKAITGNIPNTSPLYGRNPNDISAGDFRNLWLNKFGGSTPATGGAPVAAVAPSMSPSAEAAAAPVGDMVASGAPMDIRPITPPAPQEAPNAGGGIMGGLGMIDPNKMIAAANKYGPGNGMLNQGGGQSSNPMNNPEVAAMMQSRPIQPSAMSQAMRQQILASIFSKR